MGTEQEKSPQPKKTNTEEEMDPRPGGAVTGGRHGAV